MAAKRQGTVFNSLALSMSRTPSKDQNFLEPYTLLRE